ncbi:MAG: trypsin-like peptidase domain-containing protein, partial [Chloroflexota bacterium]
MFGDVQLGIATGFIWEHENMNYLVTNWHVMTGFHPQTKQPIRENGATPDVLRIWLHTVEHLGKWESLDVNLFDNQGRPHWKEHKVFRENVDVAIIRLELPDKFKAFPINRISFDEFRVEISQDVFIVGYPRGITGAGKLPIWKRGSIASEPD